MSSPEPRLVVQRQRPRWLIRLLVAVVAAVFLISGWGLYSLGKAGAPGDLEHVRAERDRIEQERRRLVEENRRLQASKRELQERLVVLERSADIDREATAELRESLRQMQERVAEYKKELAFYKGIVSSGEGGPGVRVQQFEVLPANGDPDIYRINLVLIQAARHERQVRGRARLRFEGLRNGESMTLDWRDVALDSAPELVFSFKYFQELGGVFRLPEDFEPTLVEVEIEPETGGTQPFTDSFEWQQLAQAAR